MAIVPGGRAGLIRIAAVLNNAYLGFFIPDYTAYNEMLSLFRNVHLNLPKVYASLNVTSLLRSQHRYLRMTVITSMLIKSLRRLPVKRSMFPRYGK